MEYLIFSLLIFLIPSNLFKVLDTNAGYISGLRIDYLIPKLFVSDIVLILLAAYLTIAYKKQVWEILKKYTTKIVQIGLLGLLFASVQLLTPEPLVSVLLISRVYLLGFISFFLLNTKAKSILYSQITFASIFLTILFQSLVGLLQFFTQSSVATYLFFGETNLQAFAGIARGTWNYAEYILPYGTTAHPNILAGTLVVLTLILILIAKKHRLKYAHMLIGISFLLTFCIILLTQSFSAGLSLVVGILLFTTKKHIKLSIVQIFLFTLLVGVGVSLIPSQTQSLVRRAYLNTSAITAFSDNLFWGVGVQKFTSVVEKYSSVSEVVRFTQPAHNVSLMLLSELGLIGLFLLGSVITLYKQIFSVKTQNRSVLLLSSIPILALDHYLYTIQTGILLLWLIFLYSFALKSK